MLRVGTTDYEVYPCTYNANAGYYVPWEGSASGQFWIADPRWEWGGDGGALCADSDGDWRDNGVREGDPHPDWGDEYRRAQTAWNNAQAAFSASVARIAQMREQRALRAQEIATQLLGEEDLGAYDDALLACFKANRDAEEPDPAIYNACLDQAVQDYPREARTSYSQLEADCRRYNPVNPNHPEGPDAAYQSCLTAGEGGSEAEPGNFKFRECGQTEQRNVQGDTPVTTCATRPKVDAMMNPVLDENNQPVLEFVLGSGRVRIDQVVLVAPIPNPEPILNPPSPTPTPTAEPTPEPNRYAGITSCDFATRWLNDFGDDLNPGESGTWEVVDGGDGNTYSYDDDHGRFEDYIFDPDNNC